MSRVVHVRLEFTRNEMDRLMEAAELHGVPVATFIRRTAIDKAETVEAEFRRLQLPSFASGSVTSSMTVKEQIDQMIKRKKARR